MGIIPEDIFSLIQKSDTISDKERLSIFNYLSSMFSLIPLRGGFPKDRQDAAQYKSPIGKNWQEWCLEKRKFLQSEFQPERAGIACGPASKVLVVDIDNLAKFQEWMNKEKVTLSLDSTFAVKTGGDGERYHLYFQYPEGQTEYRNRSEKGVFDIRGLGGQVVCPGSLHPETKKPYTIHCNKEISEAPGWILEYILKNKKGEKSDPAITETPEKISKSFLENQEFNGIQGIFQEDLAAQVIENIPLDSINVSKEIKDKINTFFSKGNRSEPSMAVLLALIAAGVTEENILKIYENYPIGEKTRENLPWFESEIKKAKEYVQALLDKKNGGKDIYDEIHICTLKDIQQANIVFEYHIDNFWPKGEHVLITGAGGVGKSLLALNLALDISLGNQKFLDYFTIQKTKKVVFIQSENTLNGTKKRIDTILLKHKHYASILNQIYFIGLGNDIRIHGDIFNFNKLREKLSGFMTDYSPDIVIIDPLISFHSADENSNDAMRKVLDDMDRFFLNHKVDLCLIHHEGKQASGSRGASAITDWSPNVYRIVPKNKDRNAEGTNAQNALVLNHIKSRNFELNPKLDLIIDSLRFRVINSSANMQSSSSVSSLQPDEQNIISSFNFNGNRNNYSGGKRGAFEKYKDYCIANSKKPRGEKKFKQLLTELITKSLISEDKSTYPTTYHLVK